MQAPPQPPPTDCPPPPTQAPPVHDLVGLALSGGGIRSASFNLGVLQGLASRHALWLFDYVSTVSGGGFIGSWWSAWLSRRKQYQSSIFPPEEELEPQRRRDTAVLLDARGNAAPVPSLPDGSLIARREDPIHFVRLFSNYLTPKTGALSPDTWRLITFYVRSLLLTWAALLPLLLAAVLAAQSFYLTDQATARAFLCPPSPADAERSGGRPSPPRLQDPGVSDSWRLLCAEPSAGDAARSRQVRLRHVATPAALVFAAFATSALLWLAHSSARVGLALFSFLVLLAVGSQIVGPVLPATGSSGGNWAIGGVVVATVLAHVIRSIRNYERIRQDSAVGGAAVHATSSDHRGWLTKQQAWLLRAATFLGLLALFAGFGHDVMWFLFSGGGSVLGLILRRVGGWGALALAIGSAGYTALKAAPSSTGATAAEAGVAGRVVIALAPPLVLLVLTFSFALLAHALVVLTVQQPGAIPALARALLWLAFLAATFAIYESAHDPIDPLAAARSRRGWFYLLSPRGWVRLALAVEAALIVALGWRAGYALTFRPLVAIAILVASFVVTTLPQSWRLSLASARPAALLVIATGTATLSLLTSGDIQPAIPPGPFAAALLWIVACVGGVIGIGWLADPNLLSLHAFYKGRLVRAYLGASNTARANEEVTDSAPGDDLRLTQLWNHDAGAPYHLINTTLSLVGGSDLATSQRMAENFVMTRYHCGSARAGYRCTAQYMSGDLSLGTAAAISGAAVSPTLGSATPTAALTLLLSLLNLRLGFWAPTPSGRRWNEPRARLWPFYLLREALANTGRLGTYSYLTDGGHFDNTGLYALVERGCRYIVICDCGADPKLAFQDIGVAIRRCRIDFGAEIDLSLATFLSTPLLPATQVVRGTIIYQPSHLEMLQMPSDPASQHGVVIWVKPAITRTSAVDVRQYGRGHRDFPQQSTSDQWYDESQFESYRRLGYESGRNAFADPGLRGLVEGDFSRVADWFR